MTGRYGARGVFEKPDAVGVVEEAQLVAIAAERPWRAGRMVGTVLVERGNQNAKPLRTWIGMTV